MIDVRDLRKRRGDRTDAQRPDPRLQMIKRWGLTVLGVALLIGGGAMLVLPGPGILVVSAGLTVLATEFIWARRLLVPARRWADRALTASAATPRARALTMLSEVAMLGLGVAMIVAPGVGIPFWGWTTGAMLIVSALFSAAIRLRHNSTVTPPNGLR